ncbi:hypothetical protein JMUB7557_27650 [Staphylococcus aureus]
MKLKTLVIGGSGLFLMVFSLLLFVAILFSDFFEAEDGIRDRSVSRGLGDVYKRQQYY